MPLSRHFMKNIYKLIVKIIDNGTVTIMLEPNILAPVLAEYKYLPTQVSIGEGPYASQLLS
jgi:hypothetical protein